MGAWLFVALAQSEPITTPGEVLDSRRWTAAWVFWDENASYSTQITVLWSSHVPSKR